MAAVLGGIALFFVGAEKASATAPDPRLGNWLGLASGLAYALLLVGMRWLAGRGHGESTLAATALGNAMAFAAALPMALPVRGAGVADAAVVGYLGVFQIGLAYWCLTRGIRWVPGVEATTLLMVEPVMNPVWAWVLIGERPGAWALAGGGVIVAATLVSTWAHARR